MSVSIHGKEYKTVAERVQGFRASHPLWTIDTLLTSVDDKTVIVRAEIKDDTGRLIASGFAEEKRNSSPINKTSSLENCETSAVGRALAFFGLAGSEIASADEVANAIRQERTNKTPQGDPIKAWENTWLERITGLTAIDDGHRAHLIELVKAAAASGDRVMAEEAMKEIKGESNGS